MRRRNLMAIAVLCIIALTGCGDEGATDTASPAAGATETASPEPTGTEDASPAGAPTLAVERSDLGEILVDADGMTLYVFLPDEGGDSTCYDDCAANWPPLTVDGDPVAGDGVDDGLLGTTPRDDGSTQVTYDGWPLYLFAADAAPGDVNGQGVGDVWYVVGPDGAAITRAEDDEKDGGGGGAKY